MRRIFGVLLIVLFNVEQAIACGQATASYNYTCAAGNTTGSSSGSVGTSNGDCTGGSNSGGGAGGASGAGGGGTYVLSGSNVTSLVPMSDINTQIKPLPPRVCYIRDPNEPTIGPAPSGGLGDPSGSHGEHSDPVLNIPNFAKRVFFSIDYDSRDHNSGDLGIAWRHNYESTVKIRKMASLYIGASGGWESTSNVCSSSACVLAPYSTGQLPITPNIVAEVRAADGKHLFYTLTKGIWQPPAGESAQLVMTGTVSQPTGFTLTDADKTVYTYGASGKLTAITDYKGNSLTLIYSVEGYLSSVKDPDGRVIFTFNRDASGKLSSIADIANNTYVFAYNSSGMLSSYTPPEGEATYEYTNYSITGLDTFAGGYFSGGNRGVVTLLTRTNSPNGGYVEQTYGPAQHVVEFSTTSSSTSKYVSGTLTPAANNYVVPMLATDSGYVVDADTFASWYFPKVLYSLTENQSGNISHYEYTVDEKTGQAITKVTQPLGQVYAVRWHTSNGAVLVDSITDPANGAQTIVFDSNNRPARVTDRAGRSTAYAYNDDNKVITQTDPVGLSQKYTYDARSGKVATLTDERGNITTYEYDSQGNNTGVTKPGGGTSHLTYSAHGAVTGIFDALNHGVSFNRDANGFITSMSDSSNRTIVASYDSAGRVNSLAGAGEYTGEYTYDSDNSTLSHAVNGNATRYGYGASIFGDRRPLTSVTDANNHTTTLGYDSKNRIVSLADPLGNTYRYGYDGSDNLTSMSDAKGNSLAYSYNNLSQLVSITAPDASTSYAYDTAGDLASAENNTTKIKFGYDALGRITLANFTDKVSGAASGLQYTYDGVGNRLSMTMPTSSGQSIWTYSYNADNKMTSVTSPDGKLFQFSYDAAGNRTHMDMGTAIGVNYTYDASNLPVSITYRKKTDNSVIAAVSYTYNSAGELTGRTDDFGVHSYSYDSAERLSSAVYPSSGPLAGLSESFSYDAVGNRLSDEARNGYSYDAANRLTQESAFTYSYDNNGNPASSQNRASGEIRAYLYNSGNHITGITQGNAPVASYRYDVLGRRIEKNSGSDVLPVARYIYDNANIAAILTSSNTVAEVITHGPRIDEPLMYVRNGNNYFLLADALGSIIAVADAQGNVVERIQYKAYGEPVVLNTVSQSTSAISSVGNIYGYTAHEYDAGAGLIYARARYYEPNTGRFLEQEPLFRPLIGWRTDINSQSKLVYNNPATALDVLENYQKYGSASAYVYALNIPTQYVDYDGKFTHMTIVFVAGILVITIIYLLFVENYKLYKHAHTHDEPVEKAIQIMMMKRVEKI